MQVSKWYDYFPLVYRSDLIGLNGLFSIKTAVSDVSQ